jgi:hypothetical protein
MLFGFLSLSSAQAATTVSGSITANTLWAASQSPYNVTVDVSIDNGAALTVEAGVTVYMNSGTNLIVNNGTLIAQGSSSAPIIVTSGREVSGANPGPAAGDWGQLQFRTGTVSASTLLDYVQIRYGHGIGITSASPTINHTSLTSNTGAAITIDLISSPVGSGLTATGNGLNGVLVPAGDVLSNVTWGLRGIPYVVTGVVSVGQSPAITFLTPNVVSQGSPISAVVTGVRLASLESAAASDSHITVTLMSGATATSVPVQIAADTSAAPGAATLTLQVAAGTLTVPFTITPVTANLGVVPSLLAAPPNNTPHNFLVTLSRADTVPNVISVAVDNTNIATVSPAFATIAAGQTQSTFQLTGNAAGQTTLRVTAPGFVSVNALVYVAADYTGVNTAYSPLLGVQVGASGSAGTTYSGLVSPLLGVQVGTSGAAGTTYSGLVSPLLGVQVGTSGAAGTTYSGLVSPLLGVQVGTSGSASTTYSGLVSSLLGVHVGP